MLDVYLRLAFQDPAEQIELAILAEQLGFDGVTVPDHVFFPHFEPGAYPYTKDGQLPFALETPWPDAAVVMGAIAATTTRLRMLTSVYLPPLRHPLLTAKAIGTAAVIARGRISLGVGVGWMREEFDVLGVPFEERGSRTDETIVALRALWRSGAVEHHGRHFSFGPILAEPVPEAPVPILVGGSSAPAIRRAVRLGDGYVTPEGPIPEMLEVARGVRARVAEAGRDSSAFTIFLNCTGADAAELAAVAPAIDIAGVMPWSFREALALDERKAAVERFAEEVLVPLRERLDQVRDAQGA